MDLFKGKSYHLHAGVGVLISIVCSLAHMTPGQAFLVAVALGTFYEYGDGCFTRKADAPWSGILDTIAFLPVPAAVWIIAAVRA